MKPLRPTVLLILDGWGLNPSTEANAVALAKTPNMDRLWKDCPHATLTTFGPKVGLPEGQMGNSEVGHLNIGAGRIVHQQLPRISNAIANGEFDRLIAESGLADTLKQSGGTCHVVGLVSEGGVHSHYDHGIAVCKALASAGIPVAMHAITDGRDTAPDDLPAQLAHLCDGLPDQTVLATVSGRYYAMDRDKRWDRVEKAYAAIRAGVGPSAKTVDDVLAQAVSAETTAEFIVPTVLADYDGIKDGDGLICFNFRPDRARELLSALLNPDFALAGQTQPDIAAAVGMVRYGAELDAHMKVLFGPPDLADGLGETLAKAGLAQMRMAETEKYPHVTYFLNGGREEPYAGEDRILVPSPKVASYDLQPEMSAPELTDELVKVLEAGAHAFVAVNFANPDMVGHTGDLDAAIAAVETVDTSVGVVSQLVASKGGALLVIADHGNCEQMLDERGAPHTAHTTNPVPIILQKPDGGTLSDGILADVAPSILQLLGVDQPAAMTGRSLIS